MDNLRLENFIRNLVPQAEIKAGKQFTEVTVPAHMLHELSVTLKDSKEVPMEIKYKRVKKTIRIKK